MTESEMLEKREIIAQQLWAARSALDRHITIQECRDLIVRLVENSVPGSIKSSQVIN